MPSGTGKTVSLLSLIVAYQQYYPERRKLIYCSRQYLLCLSPFPPSDKCSALGTMSEIEKALAELKALMKYRAEDLGYEEEFRGLCLTSGGGRGGRPAGGRGGGGAGGGARGRGGGGGGRGGRGRRGAPAGGGGAGGGN